MRSRNTIGTNLRIARVARGLSVIELAEKAGITKQAVYQIQSDEIRPSSETISRIARVLGFPIGFFTKADPVDLTHITVNFRSRKTADAKRQDQILQKGALMENAIRIIEDEVNLPDVSLPEFSVNPGDASEEEIERAAHDTRRAFGIGLGPIVNLTMLLENHGIFALPLRFPPKIDAFSLWMGKRPFIMLDNSTVSSVRMRFSLAHELGHLVMHRGMDNDTAQEQHDEIEKEADLFASAFLLPKETFSAEFYSCNLNALEKLKERWKVSMQAIVTRAHQLKLISDSNKTSFFVQLSKAGGRKREPLDDKIPVEEPYLLSKGLSVMLQTVDDLESFTARSLLPIDLLQEAFRSIPSFSSSAKVVSLHAVRSSRRPSNVGSFEESR